MRRRFTGLRPITRIALLAAVFVVAGIGSAAVYAARQHPTCTLIGTVEGVHVALGLDRERTDVPGRTGLRSVAICAGARCRTLRPADLLLDHATVEWQPTGPARVEVAVAIDRYDRPVELATGTVELRSAEINGPGCGVSWDADAVVRGHRVIQVDRRLSALHPSG